MYVRVFRNVYMANPITRLIVTVYHKRALGSNVKFHLVITTESIFNDYRWTDMYWLNNCAKYVINEKKLKMISKWEQKKKKNDSNRRFLNEKWEQRMIKMVWSIKKSCFVACNSWNRSAEIHWKNNYFWFLQNIVPHSNLFAMSNRTKTINLFNNKSLEHSNYMSYHSEIWLQEIIFFVCKIKTRR